MEMTFEEFCTEAEEYLREQLPEYKISLMKAKKINGYEEMQISACAEGTNIAPSISLKPFYGKLMEGEILLSVLEEMAATAVKAQRENLDMSWFSNWEEVKKVIIPKAVNSEKNDFSEIPGRKLFGDIGMVYYTPACINGDNLGFITVRAEYLRSWKVTEEDLFEAAMENLKSSKRELRSIVDVICEMDPIFRISNTEEQLEAMKKEMPMYLLTNINRTNGANQMFLSDSLKEISEDIFGGGNFYIIPSSVHELLLVPDREEEREKIVDTIGICNQGCVLPQEYLSDTLYKYDGKRIVAA